MNKITVSGKTLDVSELASIAIKYDNIDTISIEVPVSYDGTDLSQDAWYLRFKLPGGTVHTDLLSDGVLSDDEQTITFSYQLKDLIVSQSGTVALQLVNIPSDGSKVYQTIAGPTLTISSTLEGSPSADFNQAPWVTYLALYETIRDQTKEYRDNAQEAQQRAEEARDAILLDDGFIAVVADLENIDAVAEDLDNIDIVANDKANVDLVAGAKANIDLLAPKTSDMAALAPKATEIGQLGPIVSEIAEVAGIKTEILAVPDKVTEAETARDKAQQWAEEDEDVPVEEGKFSAKHYASKAEETAVALADSLEQIQENRLKTVENSENLTTVQNVISLLNPNGDATSKVVDYDSVSLPKTTASSHGKVQLEGLTVKNIFDNSNFENGFVLPWKAVLAGVPIVTDGVISFTATAFAGRIQQSITSSTPYAGHTLLFMAMVKASSNKVRMIATDSITATPIYHSGNNTFELLSYPKLINTTPSEIRISIEDSGESGWGEIQVKYAMCIDLTQTFSTIPDATTCAKQFPRWFSGSQSVQGVGRYRSLGKNLLPNGYVETLLKYAPMRGYATFISETSLSFTATEADAYINNYSSSILSAEKRFGVIDLRSLKYTENLYYIRTISGSTSGSTNEYVFYYDSDFICIKYLNIAFTTNGSQYNKLSIPANAVYMSIRVGAGTAGNTITYSNFMLKTDIASMEYEAYKESDFYYKAPVLRSVPSISDLIQRKEDGTYEHIQNVSDTKDISSITWQITNMSDVQIVYYPSINNLYSDMKTFTGNTYMTNVYFDGKLLTDVFSTGRTTANVGQYYTTATPTIGFLFTLGTFATVADAIAYMAEHVVEMNYQLATPVSTDIETSGLLTTEPSGTVYRQPAIAEAGIYASGLTILDSTYPIDSLESIYKVDFSTGLKTSMAVADAVIATDGLSFTHSSLANGDLVFFTYLYDDAFPVGESTITHYDSRYAVTDSGTGKVYKIGFAVTDGVISLTKTEV
jgi:hypothetical protein